MATLEEGQGVVRKLQAREVHGPAFSAAIRIGATAVGTSSLLASLTIMTRTFRITIWRGEGY